MPYATSSMLKAIFQILGALELELEQALQYHGIKHTTSRIVHDVFSRSGSLDLC